MTRTLLAGDVGGTKIHLGLYAADGAALNLIADHIYPTREYASLEAAIAEFRRGRIEAIAAACFGAPGPVIGQVIRPVNIPWEMRESEISAALDGAPVRLLNDLEATAWGTLRLRDTEFETLQQGAAETRQGNVVVIAAGTGLGEAGMVRIQNGWRVVASEGGHADFGPRGAEQTILLQFLQREFDHVSFERVVSGPGLHNIYQFLVANSTESEPEWLVERMRTMDPSAVIGEAALAGRDARCVHAIEVFTAIYGA
jgi:glucokinase